ncbi:hypothetical protein C0J52_16022, partial [Blattella germanica]
TSHLTAVVLGVDPAAVWNSWIDVCLLHITDPLQLLTICISQQTKSALYGDVLYVSLNLGMFRSMEISRTDI